MAESSERREIAQRLTPAVAWTLAGLAVVAAGFLGVDRWLYVHVAERFNTPDPLDRDWYTLTRPLWQLIRFVPHAVGGAVVFAAIAVLRPHGWRRATVALLAALSAVAVAHVLQHSVGRLRPNQAAAQRLFAPLLSGWTHHVPVGFPSGEAATAAAIAVILWRNFPRYRGAWLAVGAIPALVRALPGMHYLGDVVAGALVGSWVTWWSLGPARRVVLWVERVALPECWAGLHQGR